MLGRNVKKQFAVLSAILFSSMGLAATDEGRTELEAMNSRRVLAESGLESVKLDFPLSLSARFLTHETQLMLRLNPISAKQIVTIVIDGSSEDFVYDSVNKSIFTSRYPNSPFADAVQQYFVATLPGPAQNNSEKSVKRQIVLISARNAPTTGATLLDLNEVHSGAWQFDETCIYSTQLLPAASSISEQRDQ